MSRSRNSSSRAVMVAHIFKNNMQHITIGLTMAAMFFFLFRFRSLDDNSSASWDWVFSVVNAAKVYGYLAAAVLLAFIASRTSPPRRFTSVVLFLASFALAALFWSIPEFNVDASRYFSQAKHLERNGVSYFFREWGGAITAWSDLPAVPFLYGVAFKLFGEHRIVIQLITTTLFSMTIVLTHLTGRLLWDEETGFFAAALMLASPYLYIQVPLMLVDVPTMFFLSLTVFMYIKALREGGFWMWCVSPAAIFMTFFTKYSAWPMLSVLCVMLVIFAAQVPVTRRRILRNGLVPALISLVVIAIVLTMKHEVAADQIRLLIGYQRPAMQRWVESFLSIYFFQIHPFITLFMLYSLVAAWKKKDYTYAIIAWLPALALLFQVKRIRYLLPLLPMITLMAAYGLREISDRRAAKFIIAIAMFTSLVVALFAYVPYLSHIGANNLIDAGRFLDSLSSPNAEVVVLPDKDDEINAAVAVPLLDLATTTPLVYQYEPILPGADALSSRYRFSWGYKNPVYYTEDGNSMNNNRALVVISSEMNERLPPALAGRIGSFKRCKVFDKHVDLFTFQTAVRVCW